MQGLKIESKLQCSWSGQGLSLVQGQVSLRELGDCWDRSLRQILSFSDWSSVGNITFNFALLIYFCKCMYEACAYANVSSCRKCYLVDVAKLETPQTSIPRGARECGKAMEMPALNMSLNNFHTIVWEMLQPRCQHVSWADLVSEHPGVCSGILCKLLLFLPRNVTALTAVESQLLLSKLDFSFQDCI